jgi:hypothetical protein
MTVADLQQHLADLARLMESASARAVAGDLAAIRDALTPFRDSTLKAFAGFLGRAEAWSRGDVPITPARGGRGGARPAVKADADGIVREIRALYDQAGSQAVSVEQIETAVTRLTSLSKGALVAVAEGIEMKGMKSKSKDAILTAVRQRLLAVKGSAQRAGLIDRPSANERIAAP